MQEGLEYLSENIPFEIREKAAREFADFATKGGKNSEVIAQVVQELKGNKQRNPSFTSVVDIDRMPESTVKSAAIPTKEAVVENEDPTVLKERLTKLITDFPQKQDAASKLRDDALSELNVIKDKYKKIHNSKGDDHADVKKHIEGTARDGEEGLLASQIKQRRLEQAKKDLSKDEAKELEAAEAKYKLESQKAKAVLDQFKSSITAITSNKSVDLSNYQIPKLDNQQLNARDIITESIARNKSSHSVSKTDRPKIEFNKAAGKESTSGAQVADMVPQKFSLSEATKQMISEYEDKYSQENKTRLSQDYDSKLNQIMDQMIQAKPESERAKYADNLRIGENVEKDYVDAVEKANSTKEGKALSAFQASKKEKQAEIIGSVKADLVPSAIRLSQLNDSLGDNRINPKSLDRHMEEVFSSHLSGDNDFTSEAAKREFKLLVKDKDNISAYQYKEGEIPATLEEKQQKMKEVGIKELELVPQTSKEVDKKKREDLKAELLEEFNGKVKNSYKKSKGNSELDNVNKVYDTIKNRFDRPETGVYKSSDPDAKLKLEILQEIHKEKKEAIAARDKQKTPVDQEKPKEATVEVYKPADYSNHTPEALKEELTKLIKEFPNRQKEFSESRDAALSEKNAIQDKYKRIRNYKGDEPEMLEAMSKLPPSNKRLVASEARKERIEQAKQLLSKDETKELAAAEEKYKTASQSAKAVLDNFKSSISAITSNKSLDLSDYQSPPLDNHQLNARDAIVDGISKNKEAHGAKTAQAEKAGGKAGILAFQAKNSLLDNIPLSQDTQKKVDAYKDLYSKENETKLFAAYQNKLDQIMDGIAEERLKSYPEYKAANLKDPGYEGKDAVKYENDREAASKEAMQSTEMKAFADFRNKKEAAEKDIVQSVNLDLVPKAIKLKQLNDSLGDNDKMDPKNLDAYMGALVSSRLAGIADKTIDTAKTEFSKLVNDPDNKSAYQYRAEELPKTLEAKKELMRNSLEAFGIKKEAFVAQSLSKTLENTAKAKAKNETKKFATKGTSKETSQANGPDVDNKPKVEKRAMSAEMIAKLAAFNPKLSDQQQ